MSLRRTCCVRGALVAPLNYRDVARRLRRYDSHYILRLFQLQRTLAVATSLALRILVDIFKVDCFDRHLLALCRFVQRTGATPEMSGGGQAHAG